MATRSKKQAITAPRQRKSLSANDVKIIVADILNDMGISKSQAELQQVASVAAKQAVQETLMSLGLDVANPIAAQQMFTGLREVVHTFANKEFQADLAHVRTWRVTMSGIKSKGVGTAVGILVTAAVVALIPWARGAFER